MVDDCTAALELDPGYVKALLRRAQANEHLEKYDMALEGASVRFSTKNLSVVQEPVILVQLWSYRQRRPTPIVGTCSTLSLLAGSSLGKRLTQMFCGGNHVGSLSSSLSDAKELLKLDPGLRLAKESVPRLEKLHHDKNEKMKEEAIGESFLSVNAPTV